MPLMKKREKKKGFGAPRGRPRAFDEVKALDRAMRVFWKKGYEGASLSDLTQAMGINRPSLYAAFGNKEALFRRALARYKEGPAAYLKRALASPTARSVAEQLLAATVDLLADPGHPRGCLMVQGALSCGAEAEPVRRALAASRTFAEADIRRRLQRAKSAGDLPRDARPADLARYLATVVQGMSVQAAGGATRSELQRVAQTALRAWPN